MNNKKDEALNVPTYFNEGREQELKEELKSLEDDLPSPELKSIMGRGISVVSEARTIITNLETSRIENLRDQAYTPIGNKVRTYETSMKVKKKLYEKAQKTEEALQRQAAALDDKISRPISEEAASRFSNEIRSHLKSLPDEMKRVRFVQDLIKKKQWDSVSAAIGTKHFYLAGLSEEMQESLVEEYRKARFPKEIKAKEFLQKLAGNVGKGFAATLEQFQKLDTPEVREAMARKTAAQEAADKALNF